MPSENGARVTALIRIVAAAVLSAAVLFVPGPSRAAERIAVLVSSSEQPFEDALAGFREALEKQGISADLELHHLSRDPSRAEAAVDAIRKNNTRLIYALGSLGTDAALQGVVDIPVVSCLILRQDRLPPGGNATGVVLEFPLKLQFERMKAILPNARTIGVMYNPRENESRVEEAARVAGSMGLELEAIEVDSPRDIPPALDALSKRVDALWGLADTTTLSPQLAKEILLFAFRNGIPFVGPSEAWTKAGALYSLDWDYRDLGAQCGEMAARILRGTPAAAIPPAPPRKAYYSLNLKTAEHIRVRLPVELVRKARKAY